MASIFGADSGGEGSRNFCKRRLILKIDTFNLDLFSSRSYSETSFSASGIVNTLDGNEIDFSFEMEMARS
ncbi:MAG: hypothetical protein DRH26_08505, partial [Deltaproteobacteria bacterium]